MEDNSTNIVNNEEGLNNDNGTNNENGANSETEKTYTKEEVLKLIQSETDRRTNQALKKQQAKYEKQLSLSKLDGDEREKAEKDSRIAELEAQLAEFNVEKNKSELKTVLSSRGLSAEFADIIAISDDIEEAQANIEKLDKLFKKAVAAEVEKRISKGKIPQGNGNTSKEITKDVAKKMSMAELNKLAKENPKLFDELFN